MIHTIEFLVPVPKKHFIYFSSFTENESMDKTLSNMVKVLKFIEKNESKFVFDAEHFNAKHFKMSEGEFFRAVEKAEKKKFIEGIQTIDYGEKNEACPPDYKRFVMIYESPIITLDGAIFLENNNWFRRLLFSAKTIKELLK